MAMKQVIMSIDKTKSRPKDDIKNPAKAGAINAETPFGKFFLFI
jgi:hypothetical protein